MTTLIEILCIINSVNDKLDFKLPCLHNVTSIILNHVIITLYTILQLIKLALK